MDCVRASFATYTYTYVTKSRYLYNVIYAVSSARYFNVRKPIFLLILLDSLVSLVGSLVVTAVVAAFLAADRHRLLLAPSAQPGDYAKCTAFFMGLYFPAHAGLAFTALVAMFR